MFVKNTAFDGLQWTGVMAYSSYVVCLVCLGTGVVSWLYFSWKVKKTRAHNNGDIIIENKLTVSVG